MAAAPNAAAAAAAAKTLLFISQKTFRLKRTIPIAGTIPVITVADV